MATIVFVATGNVWTRQSLEVRERKLVRTAFVSARPEVNPAFICASWSLEDVAHVGVLDSSCSTRQQ